MQSRKRNASSCEYWELSQYGHDRSARINTGSHVVSVEHYLSKLSYVLCSVPTEKADQYVGLGVNWLSRDRSCRNTRVVIQQAIAIDKKLWIYVSEDGASLCKPRSRP